MGINEIQQPVIVRPVPVGRAQGGRDMTQDVTGLSVVQYAMARYDFAEHGGAVGSIGLGVIVPAGAIVIQYAWDLIESFDDESVAVAGFTLVDADTERLTDFRPVDFYDEEVGAPHYWGDPPPKIQIRTEMPQGGGFKLTEDREIKFIIQGAAITQGVVDCYVMYLLPQ